MPNPVREAHARIYLHTECGDFHCGEHECVTWSEDRLADTDIEYVRASAALALPAPEPAGWRYLTPHGYVVTKTKTSGSSEPLYAEPPAPREPLIELAKRWEQHSEGNAKRSYSAAFSPASAAFTEAARVYEQCATELRMLIADAAPSEIARDAARLDSGMILMEGRDEFGEPSSCLHKGMNLRAAIDAAIEQERNA